MSLFTSNKKKQYINIELTRLLGRLLGYGLDLKTALSEVRCFAHILGDEKARTASTTTWDIISEDLREGFALSDALAKDGSILSQEDLAHIRSSEEDETLPQALADCDPSTETAFRPEAERTTQVGSEAATIILLNSVINDALSKKAERVGITLKPLSEVPASEPRDADKENLDDLLSELKDSEGTPFHISFMEAGHWRPYQQSPPMFFRPVIKSFLYHAGLPYWAQDDQEGSFRILLNDEPVEIGVNFYPAKNELFIDFRASI